MQGNDGDLKPIQILSSVVLRGGALLEWTCRSTGLHSWGEEGKSCCI